VDRALPSPATALRAQGTDVATSVSSPNFLRAVSDGYLRHTITHGRAGTPMVGFAQLPAQSVDDLVAFIRSAEHVPGPPPPPTYEPPPGLDRLVINPAGRPPEFTLREGRFVPAEQVAQALQQGRRMVILDARATSDWSTGHIAGALPFPFYNIDQMAGSSPATAPGSSRTAPVPTRPPGTSSTSCGSALPPHRRHRRGLPVLDRAQLPTAHAAIIPPRR
jgi:rhodanese-related sulfurtransferase